MISMAPRFIVRSDRQRELTGDRKAPIPCTSDDDFVFLEPDVEVGSLHN